MRFILIAAVSLLLDALLGDPARMPHPVVIMGWCIRRLETVLRNAFPKNIKGERIAGSVLAGIMILGTGGISLTAVLLAKRVHFLLYLALEILWGWQCLAMKGLYSEGENVRQTLQTGTLEQAREAVGRIVGRDTENLDQEGVIRAAVESVAENFSDGVLAPLLYLMLGGAPLALCYKAINTMDSMIGYKNEKYLWFGRTAARTDDIANFIPSRLSALLLIAAAAICQEDAPQAWHIWRRDKRKHESPNSAQTEAAMAGALNIRLGGPASYFGQIHEKPWIGTGLHPPVPEDITRACRMMRTAGVLGLAVLSLIWI